MDGRLSGRSQIQDAFLQYVAKQQERNGSRQTKTMKISYLPDAGSAANPRASQANPLGVMDLTVLAPKEAPSLDSTPRPGAALTAGADAVGSQTAGRTSPGLRTRLARPASAVVGGRGPGGTASEAGRNPPGILFQKGLKQEFLKVRAPSLTQDVQVAVKDYVPPLAATGSPKGSRTSPSRKRPLSAAGKIDGKGSSTASAVAGKSAPPPSDAAFAVQLVSRSENNHPSSHGISGTANSLTETARTRRADTLAGSLQKPVTGGIGLVPRIRLHPRIQQQQASYIHAQRTAASACNAQAAVESCAAGAAAAVVVVQTGSVAASSSLRSDANRSSEFAVISLDEKRSKCFSELEDRVWMRHQRPSSAVGHSGCVVSGPAGLTAAGRPVSASSSRSRGTFSRPAEGGRAPVVTVHSQHLPLDWKVEVGDDRSLDEAEDSSGDAGLDVPTVPAAAPAMCAAKDRLRLPLAESKLVRGNLPETVEEVVPASVRMTSKRNANLRFEFRVVDAVAATLGLGLPNGLSNAPASATGRSPSPSARRPSDFWGSAAAVSGSAPLSSSRGGTVSPRLVARPRFDDDELIPESSLDRASGTAVRAALSAAPSMQQQKESSWTQGGGLAGPAGIGIGGPPLVDDNKRHYVEKWMNNVLKLHQLHTAQGQSPSPDAYASVRSSPTSGLVAGATSGLVSMPRSPLDAIDDLDLLDEAIASASSQRHFIAGRRVSLHRPPTAGTASGVSSSPSRRLDSCPLAGTVVGAAGPASGLSSGSPGQRTGSRLQSPSRLGNSSSSSISSSPGQPAFRPSGTVRSTASRSSTADGTTEFTGSRIRPPPFKSHRNRLVPYSNLAP